MMDKIIAKFEIHIVETTQMDVVEDLNICF